MGILQAVGLRGSRAEQRRCGCCRAAAADYAMLRRLGRKARRRRVLLVSMMLTTIFSAPIAAAKWLKDQERIAPTLDWPFLVSNFKQHLLPKAVAPPQRLRDDPARLAKIERWRELVTALKAMRR